MQKGLILLATILLCSCTIVRKRPPDKYSLELFDKVEKSGAFVQNEKIEIKFTTCRKRWFSDGGESKNFLRQEFKKKFGQDLYGISNMEIVQTHVVDSSIFMPNELCHKVVGNPVTKKIINLSKNEKWELVDPAHHIH